MTHPEKRTPGGSGQASAADTKQSTPIVGQQAGAGKVYTRHPLSAAFGDIAADEQAALIADIKRNGLLSAIVLHEDQILDGWHRYRACIAAGIAPRYEPFDYVVEAAAESADRKMTPAEFVCSANAHRRHLTREQRREVVAALLKADPTMSNRAIGKVAKVADNTVRAVRTELEAGAQIAHLSERTGTDGKSYTKPARPAATAAAAVGMTLGEFKQAKEVVEAAEQEAEKFGDLVETMDATGNVRAAHIELGIRRAASSATGPQPAPTAPAPKHRPKWIVRQQSRSGSERLVEALRDSADAVRAIAKQVPYGRIERSKVDRARTKLQAAMGLLDELSDGDDEVAANVPAPIAVPAQAVALILQELADAGSRNASTQVPAMAMHGAHKLARLFAAPGAVDLAKMQRQLPKILDGRVIQEDGSTIDVRATELTPIVKDLAAEGRKSVVSHRASIVAEITERLRRLFTAVEVANAG